MEKHYLTETVKKKKVSPPRREKREAYRSASGKGSDFKKGDAGRE